MEPKTKLIFEEAIMKDEGVKINMEVEVGVVLAVRIIILVVIVANFRPVRKTIVLVVVIEVSTCGSLVSTRFCLVLVHHNNQVCCPLFQMTLNNTNIKPNNKIRLTHLHLSKYFMLCSPLPWLSVSYPRHGEEALGVMVVHRLPKSQSVNYK